METASPPHRSPRGKSAANHASVQPLTPSDSPSTQSNLSGAGSQQSRHEESPTTQGTRMVVPPTPTSTSPTRSKRAMAQRPAQLSERLDGSAAPDFSFTSPARATGPSSRGHVLASLRLSGEEPREVALEMEHTTPARPSTTLGHHTASSSSTVTPKTMLASHTMMELAAASRQAESPVTRHSRRTPSRAAKLGHLPQPDDTDLETDLAEDMDVSAESARAARRYTAIKVGSTRLRRSMPQPELAAASDCPSSDDAHVESAACQPATPTSKLKALCLLASPILKYEEAQQRQAEQMPELSKPVPPYVAAVHAASAAAAAHVATSVRPPVVRKLSAVSVGNPAVDRIMPAKAATARASRQAESPQALASQADEDVDENEAEARKNRSLGLLCERFLKSYWDAQPGTSIHLDQTAGLLAVNRRRLYDIINVLESVEILRRVAKNQYEWVGMEGLPERLRRLKEAHTSPNGQLLLDDDELGSDDDSDTEQPVALRARDTNLQASSDVAKKNASRKEKSLCNLSRLFLVLMISSPSRLLTMDDAAAQLAGTGGGSIDWMDSKLKTKIRRLYDIANVLASIGLIAKDRMNSVCSRKPAFRWIYPHYPAIPVPPSQTLSMSNYEAHSSPVAAVAKPTKRKPAPLEAPPASKAVRRSLQQTSARKSSESDTPARQGRATVAAAKSQLDPTAIASEAIAEAIKSLPSAADGVDVAGFKSSLASALQTQLQRTFSNSN
ncbi:hypothetical protein CAOG_000276 [Capsaspora owczarzaki ATCC 30864]|uniref:E2F/DP family winged-helix DNA-binding domain-containing protein n=1 Tax=Capsaspora owczarzaki (strain ATCC 30864) TaxID=595528 RepID=A0A0D2X095_CAPO3|nr:hypothetical protein CAOG_000276 [Capsaspora owczarzaki ATCC 30864]